MIEAHRKELLVRAYISESIYHKRIKRIKYSLLGIIACLLLSYIVPVPFNFFFIGVIICPLFLIFTQIIHLAIHWYNYKKIILTADEEALAMIEEIVKENKMRLNK
jgi:uncharacterized protein YacL